MFTSLYNKLHVNVSDVRGSVLASPPTESWALITSAPQSIRTKVKPRKPNISLRASLVEP